MGLRRRAREIALQVLFQMEFEPSLTVESALFLYLENFEESKKLKDYARGLVIGVITHRDELDKLLQHNSQNWTLHRMAFVDKNILRVAAFELRFLENEIPSKVAIDEAIEIGKRFGTQDSPAFINGVLDNINKSLHQ